MSSEENYLDNLLNTILDPKTTEPMQEIQSDQGVENGTVEKSEISEEEPIMEEPVITGGIAEAEEPVLLEGAALATDEPVLMDEISIDSLEVPEVPDLEIPDLEIPDLDLSDLDMPDIAMSGEEINNVLDGESVGELQAGGELNTFHIENALTEDIDIGNIKIEDIDLENIGIEDADIEAVATEDIDPENVGLEDIVIGDIEAEDVEMPDMADVLQAEEGFSVGELDISDAEMLEESRTEELEEPQTEGLDVEGLGMEDVDATDMEISSAGEELSLEDIEMPESEDELKLEDIEIPEMPEMPTDELFQGNELSIDGLDQAIQSETELQMAGELNIDELDFDNISLETGNPEIGIPDSEPVMEMPDLSDDLSLLNNSEDESDVSIGMDDNLEDVLNMLDDDAELAEINDMLKKSDNNEPIQDDMMDLLHQMADDEAASVNAGIKHVDEEDDGVPLPEIPQSVLNAGKPEEETAEGDKKKKAKKASAKKKKDDAEDSGTVSSKEPGKLGKFFNLLTEEFVPEPTEEELAAEKEAKAAKKQENLTKKEEEKLAKEEAKKAKAEEKAAASRVKQEAAAQKKKEKLAKKEAKKAQLAAQGPKKRIPPKKIAVAVAFGASVGGAVVLATNILSAQGFLQTARNAYYDEDYQTVYEMTYGMELDEGESDGLIKARSEVLFKVQRRYDSYQTNLKMGRKVEALDALLQGIAVYDYVNADAEKYGVMTEVDAIKTNILNTLESEYGLDETAARALINNEDALSYTIALNDVIAGK